MKHLPLSLWLFLTSIFLCSVTREREDLLSWLFSSPWPCSQVLQYHAWYRKFEYLGSGSESRSRSSSGSLQFHSSRFSFPSLDAQSNSWPGLAWPGQCSGYVPWASGTTNHWHALTSDNTPMPLLLAMLQILDGGARIGTVDAVHG